jgi:hypothetical protein
MRDDLKAKTQQLASEQGVSLNSYINATLAATVAQSETLAMMGDRLSGVEQDKLHNRVMKFMLIKRSGSEPTSDQI